LILHAQLHAPVFQGNRAGGVVSVRLPLCGAPLVFLNVTTKFRSTQKSFRGSSDFALCLFFILLSGSWTCFGRPLLPLRLDLTINSIPYDTCPITACANPWTEPAVIKDVIFMALSATEKRKLWKQRSKETCKSIARLEQS
jgi:hypothetical protein